MICKLGAVKNKGNKRQKKAILFAQNDTYQTADTKDTKTQKNVF
jgi:hypothetical protein